MMTEILITTAIVGTLGLIALIGYFMFDTKRDTWRDNIKEVI